MPKKLALVCLSLSLLISTNATAAGTKWNGFAKLSPDGLPDAMTWAEVEASNNYVSGGCKSMNDLLKTNISCMIDHVSWQNFYKEELTHPLIEDRVNTSPDQACGATALYFFTNQLSASTQGDFKKCAEDDACRADFVSRVKSTNCIVVNKDAEPSLTLENGVMTFVITRKPNGDTPDSDAWVFNEAKKAFPLYKKLMAAYGR
jgi:hypothetical protein